MNNEEKKIAVIITGATGMVGEGVMLECLENAAVEQVLIVNRKPYGMTHAKLKEIVVADFMQLDGIRDELNGYDACFYCAGVSSLGKSEEEYTHVTYDVTMNFAKTLMAVSPEMVFIFVTGAHTDGSEKGKLMWARVKGRTENALTRLGFRGAYNFRPGFMRPVKGQRNVNKYYWLIGWTYPILRTLTPTYVSTLRDVAVAMILCVAQGYPKQVLEIRDINSLGKG